MRIVGAIFAGVGATFSTNCGEVSGQMSERSRLAGETIEDFAGAVELGEPLFFNAELG
jgi:hypothetical protein